MKLHVGQMVLILIVVKSILIAHVLLNSDPHAASVSSCYFSIRFKRISNSVVPFIGGSFKVPWT